MGEGSGGAEGNRTPDLLIANEALSQLSYSPTPCGRTLRSPRREVKRRLQMPASRKRKAPLSIGNMSHRTLFGTLLARLKSEPSRTGSVIITVYGDAIVPRGGSVWLGTLLTLFRALDIADGVVRTAASRLAADGWLERRRVGRKSFYRLATRGEATFAEATAHIYGPRPQNWRGEFHLAILQNGPEREARRAALEALGYGTLAPGVMMAPDTVPPPEASAGYHLLARAETKAAQELASRVWPLARVAERYRSFLEMFGPAEAAIREAAQSAELEAMLLRILLIHEYRRIVLRDPLLPEALLPQPWPGRTARTLCARLYHALLPASEAWLDAHGLTENGPLPPPTPLLFSRFQDEEEGATSPAVRSQDYVTKKS